MAEILSLRTESSKTFDLGGGKRRLETQIGVIHYRDNYADLTEAWKDIDLTWVSNQILTAPYELTKDGNKLTFKNKKTGEVSTIERTSVFPPGIDLEVIPELSAVRFRHTLPSDKVPLEAKFAVTGKVPITRAFDDEGELELETSLVNGILTEKLSQVKDKKTGQVRPAKGNIRVDPTWQVGAGSDDCRKYYSGSWLFSLTAVAAYAGNDGADYLFGGGLRFTNVTIPQGSTINSALLTRRAYFSYSGTVVRTRIRGELATNAATFSTLANLDGRVRTTASVDYDGIGADTANTNYDTIDFASVIQEIVNQGGWASGNALVVFWDDFDNRSDSGAGTLRSYYTYEGSTTYAVKLTITYTEGAPVVVTPSTLALTLTAYAPTISTPVSVTPTTLALTLTTYAPTIQLPIVVTPSTLALTTTKYAPSIILGTIVTPGVASLATTLLTPTVTTTANVLVTPTTLALTLTTYAPTISTPVTVTPTTLALLLTAYTPTIELTVKVIPTTLALTLTTYAPTITIPLWYPVQVDWNNDGDFDDANEDITGDVKSIHFSRGKSDELGKAEVGQLSITLNNANGKYTPSNSAGALYGNLKPKRPIRIRTTYEGTIYNLFYGFIEEIIPHPHLAEQDCIITAVDGLDFLSRHDMATALYKDALTGTIHTYILDDADWSASLRTLDAGQDTVPYWYGHDVKARFAQEEIDDSEQGFSYVDGSGKFNFEDRYHRSTVTHQTSQATFSDTMSYITYSLNSKNVYNIIKVTATPWAIQTIAELWKLQETPSIPVGETLTWWGEASVSGKAVFVDAWTTPVSTTDYTANSQAGGGGTNMTSDIAIVTTKFAKTIKLAITNNGTVPAFITLLKARGTYYDDQTKVTRKAEDSTSQTNYQKRTLEIDGKYMTDADLAQGLASYAIGKYKDPRAEISMTLQNQNSATLTQILSREISDRITVVNTKLGVNADYFIDYLEHDISISGKWHTATYRLADSENEDFWCLDYSALGTQTKLGY